MGKVRFTTRDREKLESLYAYYGPARIDEELGLAKHHGRIPRLWINGGRKPTANHIQKIRTVFRRIPKNIFTLFFSSTSVDFDTLFNQWEPLYGMIKFFSNKRSDKEVHNIAKIALLNPKKYLQARIVDRVIPLGEDKSIGDVSQLPAWYLNPNDITSLYKGLIMVYQMTESDEQFDNIVGEMTNWYLPTRKLWITSTSVRRKLLDLLQI